MPLYEYRCQACGNEEEKIKKSDDTVSCSKCGAKMVKKVSKFSFIMK